jgi:hypothetical protein
MASPSPGPVPHDQPAVPSISRPSGKPGTFPEARALKGCRGPGAASRGITDSRRPEQGARLRGARPPGGTDDPSTSRPTARNM